MTRQEAAYQAIATCGALHIGFIGLAHEFIGAQLFPWAPQALGLMWHPAGLSVVAIGMLLLAGTLGWIRYPVVPLALLMVAVGVLTVVLIEVLHQQFHFLALTLAMAGVMTAIFHHKAEQLRKDGRVLE